MLYKELQIAVIVFFSLAFVSTTLNVTNCQNVAYHMPVASYGTGNGWRGTGPRGLPSPPTAIMQPAPFLLPPFNGGGLGYHPQENFGIEDA